MDRTTNMLPHSACQIEAPVTWGGGGFPVAEGWTMEHSFIPSPYIAVYCHLPVLQMNLLVTLSNSHKIDK